MRLPPTNIEGQALSRFQLMDFKFANARQPLALRLLLKSNWGFGTSRWQLRCQPTSSRSREKRVNVAY
jgi:hypothetical protein